MIPFADGSDLGASVRNPAAFCSLYGLRPTPGRIPDHGPGDPYNPFLVLGALARTPQDVALLFSALAGPDLRDPLSIQEPWPLPGKPRVQPSKGCGSPGARRSAGSPSSPEVTAALQTARATLEDLGCIVENAEPDFSGADECFEVLRGVAFTAFADIAEDVKPTLRANIRFGQHLDAARIGKALSLRGELFTRMREFLGRYDFLAAPVTQVAPFSVDLEYPTEIAGRRMGSYLEWFRSCSRITVTGHPALAVPAGFTPGRAADRPAARRPPSRGSRCCGSPRPCGSAMPWPTTAPTDAHRASYREAEARSFWLRTPHEPTPALTEPTSAGPVHRRRRLHRPVGGAVRGAAGQGRRRPRGRDGRVRRQRAQRRLRGRLAHARDRQRHGALRRRDAGPGAARARELPGHPGRPADPRHRLRLRGHRRAPGADRRISAAVDGGARSCSPASATRSRSWTRPRCRPRSARPPTSAASGIAPAPASWTPASSRSACATRPVRAGVRIYEHSAVHHITDELHVLTAQGRVQADRVLLATSAYPPLVNAIKRYVVPVYDYVLTEPLDLTRVGWVNRQGIGDGGNQFHYYRPTKDGRILYGGWDAVYRYKGPVGPRHDEHDATFAKLAQHFFHTFPQLEGTRFTHRWGGAIDTSSRFSVFFGTAHKGRLAYATGYTGLGVAAARFGGRTAVDILDRRETDATRTRYVRSKPIPFPPEPLRYAVIQYTRNRLAAADRNAGPERTLAAHARPPRARLRLLQSLAMTPDTLSGSPAALRSFWAISAISSGA